MTLPRPLPPQFQSLALLAKGAESEVHHARGPEGEVALRIAATRDDAPGRAELGVLAAVDHPGLARLKGFGQVPETGDRWVARSWVEGVDLREWSAETDDKALGALVAQLCLALQHLHERGFVHADLKPENVLVEGQGTPILTDFGLSRSRGSSGDIAGSLFYVAPEILGGANPKPAADLFALGVTLHTLLLTPQVTAADFYARFPSTDYFEATGTQLSDLPEWARGVLAALLDRDPALRPASAAVVGATLRARLGLPASQSVEDLRCRVPGWSPIAGREAWLAGLPFAAETTVLLQLPEGEDPEAFARGLQLWMALRGESVHLLGALEEHLGAADLDGYTERILADAGEGILLVPLVPGDHDAWRRLGYLLRLVRQRRRQATEGVPCVLALSQEPAPAAFEAVKTFQAPPLELSTLEELLQGELGDPSQDLARVLLEASGGALEQARCRLQRGFARGDFVHGVEGICLRSGAHPEHWGQALGLFEGSSTPSHDFLRLLAALEVCEGRAEPERLRRLLEVEDESFAATLRDCVVAGHVRWVHSADRPAQVVSEAALEERVFEELGPATVQELYERRCVQLDSMGASPLALSLARYAAEPSRQALEAVLEGLQEWVDAWRPELALTAAEQLERLARRFEPAHLQRAAAEVAVCWARLGELDRAENRLQEIEREGATNAEALATLERARGVIAHERHDFELAVKHMRRAYELSSEDGGDSLWRQVMLAFDRRAEEEVDELCAKAQEQRARMRASNRWNLQALRGLSLCRRGQLKAGLAQLEQQLAEATARHDTAREAHARLNLATVQRRSGDAERAVLNLRGAARIHEKQNHLPGLAQARAMLGGTLRGVGQLQEADEMLRSAYVLRERLGDESGAMAARGMLGLVYADRGLLRMGLDELGASATALRGAQRSADALLLEASALELEARLCERRPRRLRGLQAGADPRLLISHGRAAALWGEREQALDCAGRALELATKLGLESAQAEASFLLRVLKGEALGDDLHQHSTPRVGAQRAAWQWLRQSPDQFQEQEVSEAANAFAAQGFMDLAARLAMAVVARAESTEKTSAALVLAKGWLEQVMGGLTEDQVRRAHLTLMGLPDPRPADIEAYESALTEGGSQDMDIISILDINQRLVSQQDLSSLLGEIVESALAVTRAERGFLVLEHDGEIEFDTARHSRRGDIEDPELEVSSSVLRHVFESGETLRLSNAGDDPLLSGAASVEQLDLRSILVTSFIVDESLRGAIYVDHRLKAGAFSERAEQLLELLASQAALAIRQVRRLEEIKDLNEELNQRVRDREAQLVSNRQALEEAGASVSVANIVGSSEAIQRVHSMIARAAPAALPVLVCGESGTGKDLAARALHLLSDRVGGPLVAENCAALPPALIESELFGYTKGAFTGANTDRAGIFERADGGTLFLDEIGELPIELQAKLLRVLETGELRRVGGSKLMRTDFRLVVATNRDLQVEVAANRFRADLMYRIDALRIDMPALREHVEDIPDLVEHFMKMEERGSEPPRKISKKVLAALMRRDWPGNVRELANEVSRLCVLSTGDLEDPSLIRSPAAGHGAAGSLIQASGGITPIALVERQAIEHALRETGNDKRLAASKLGISRAKLYQRLKEWAIEDAEPGGVAEE